MRAAASYSCAPSAAGHVDRYLAGPINIGNQSKFRSSNLLPGRSRLVPQSHYRKVHGSADQISLRTELLFWQPRTPLKKG